MLLSDLSVKRPVFAIVVNLLIAVFGIISFTKLPLREYPDINPPVVSVDTIYRGASAAVVESRITRLLEDRVSGIEGIKNISSNSRDGQSSITIEFELSRDIDAAANDVRERLSRAVKDLPDEAEPPEIYKVDANTDVIVWFSLISDNMSTTELTDYAERYLVDALATVDGVARVRVAGGSRFAMRIWLDRLQLAARGLTVADIESALRRENVELPAGRIESVEREFTVRAERAYRTPREFSSLVISKGKDGHLTRLGEVARVELGPEEDRSFLRSNGKQRVGVGIIKQSTANALAVARGVKQRVKELSDRLPPNIKIMQSYDTSVFIEYSVHEVYLTLGIAAFLVVGIIFCFLGTARAMLIPAVTVPVSLLGSFILLYALGYSVNILTLLALILAIGLVVDDAIVVLENIAHRMEQGEPPLLAAYRGTRQVGFAVVATSLVLAAVFAPLGFLQGNVGRLFVEFAVAVAGSVLFSALVALTLSPVMASKFLKNDMKPARISLWVDRVFERLQNNYRNLLIRSLDRPLFTWLLVLVVLGLCGGLYAMIPKEFAPTEDRGAFNIMAQADEGTTMSKMTENMNKVESILLPLLGDKTHKGDAVQLMTRIPGSFSSADAVNSGMVIVVLDDWGKRRTIDKIIASVMPKLSTIPEVKVFPVQRRAFGQRTESPVQFVLGGAEFAQLAAWRDAILEKARDNPGLTNLDADYKETKPQLLVKIDTTRAGDLGVPAESIGGALETMLGESHVTTFMKEGEEYDVILEGDRTKAQSVADVDNIYVRSQTTNELIPLSNLISITEVADAATLPRYNRMRAITITANLTNGYALGDALQYLVKTARETAPDAIIDYKGESLEYQRAGSDIIFTFIMALLVVYLVLAAQFESFVHPGVIMFTVPLALAGGLIGLFLTGLSINIYSQIGMIMLVGLATKNGILIVEFANQLRDAGMSFRDALVEAASRRLRPIIMTSLATVMGAVPLAISHGAGAESRQVIGTVVVFGVTIATLMTLTIVPVAYQTLARNTRSPEEIARELKREDEEHPDHA
ncbi:MMPL family transporter [bacterium]|nr:MMPL family transporter [bacterium]